MNRENKTAEVGNSEEDLIQGIISTTREMKRVFRKHSMELRKENASKKADLCL